MDNKIYVVIEDRGCGERMIIGLYSTKNNAERVKDMLQKADNVMDAIDDGFLYEGELEIIEYNIDEATSYARSIARYFVENYSASFITNELESLL